MRLVGMAISTRYGFDHEIYITQVIAVSDVRTERADLGYEEDQLISSIDLVGALN